MDSSLNTPPPSVLHVQEFKELYRKSNSVVLSDVEALELLTRLLVIAKYKIIEKSRKENVEALRTLRPNLGAQVKCIGRDRYAIDELLKEMQVEISVDDP